uniref:RRM domain-containing protein n=1 Tax=Leersia perrieri TaxID=77586 RepID=A0A0D9XLG7_9ORYZ
MYCFCIFLSIKEKGSTVSRYIEFYDAMSVPMAIVLTGQLLLGQQGMFARLEDAKAAQSLNGQLDIAGKVIKVTLQTARPWKPVSTMR